MFWYVLDDTAALAYSTRKRAGGLFAAHVALYDKLGRTGNFQRVRTVYTQDGFKTRGAARHHAEDRLRELFVREDILREYG